MSEVALELHRRGVLIHVAPVGDGSFVGEDVYRRASPLRFRSIQHLRTFATKYHYTVTRITNT